jgi:phosphoglycerate kinase
MKKTLLDLDRGSLAGRTVLLRADLNVPMEDGAVADDQRLVASLPTLRYLIDSGARTVILSHFGRPKGQVVPAYSLRPVAARMAELLARPVTFVPEPIGPVVDAAVESLQDGDVAVLENTRFLPGERANDASLASDWARLGTLMVNDAFGAVHRAHASNVGLARAVRAGGGEAVAGLLLARELEFLGAALEEPERPFVAILGGAKISGKIDVVSALLPRVDRLLIGGAMANTFFRAMGLDTGRSLIEEDRVAMAEDLMTRAGEKLVLPTDCVVAEELEPGSETRVVARESVGDSDRIADVGPRTRAHFAELLADARTIVWNGPMGVFEIDEFAAGTLAVAEAVAEACDRGALGVIGGGDSAAAAERAGVVDRISHVSTGGGASLELLAGADLPGVDCLTDAE